MINVIGLGYIGLPTALMLSSSDEKVVGTDIDEELVSRLNEGRLSFYESGLLELYTSAMIAGTYFTTSYQTADIYIVAVPTPYEEKTKRVDTRFVVSAVDSVLEHCERGAIIVIESTISPGTIDRAIRPIIANKGFETGKDIHLVHAPERIIPGNMIIELRENNRTIGADDVEVGNRIKELYASFCRGEITVTDIKTAEMTKVVENTYRDINIAFANELAKVCRSEEIDVYEVIRIANKHPRVNVLMPGPGVGGHCISVDPWFLVGEHPGITNLIHTARRVNDQMPEYVLKRVSEIMDLHGINDTSRIGIYGLTYKENVDDIRESPTLQMLEFMKKHLAAGRVKVYDPYVNVNIVPNQIQSFDEFMNNIDMVVIMVGHRELADSQEMLKDKVVLDTRNVCNIDGVYRL